MGNPWKCPRPVFRPATALTPTRSRALAGPAGVSSTAVRAPVLRLSAIPSRVGELLHQPEGLTMKVTCGLRRRSAKLKRRARLITPDPLTPASTWPRRSPGSSSSALATRCAWVGSAYPHAGGVELLVRRAGALQQRSQLPRLVLGMEACGRTIGRSSPGPAASSRCPTVSSSPSCLPERASSTTSPATRPIPATPLSSLTCASSTPS